MSIKQWAPMQACKDGINLARDNTNGELIAMRHGIKLKRKSGKKPE